MFFVYFFDSNKFVLFGFVNICFTLDIFQFFFFQFLFVNLDILFLGFFNFGNVFTFFLKIFRYCYDFWFIILSLSSFLFIGINIFISSLSFITNCSVISFTTTIFSQFFFIDTTGYSSTLSIFGVWFFRNLFILFSLSWVLASSFFFLEVVLSINRCSSNLWFIFLYYYRGFG